MLKVIDDAKVIVTAAGGFVTSVVTDARAGLLQASMAQRAQGLHSFTCVCHAHQVALEKILVDPQFKVAWSSTQKSQYHKPRNLTR